MNWTHFAVLIVAAVLGLYIGAKNPSLVSKLSGGTISA